ncbi:MAG: hypothetical protein ACRENE_21305, partial [Polyangiaceae bacterium]
MNTTTTTGAGAAPGRESDARLDRFFGRDRVDLGGLAWHLDGLPDAERSRVTCLLTARQQAALFDAALAFLPLSLDFFVPPAAGSLKQVIHSGKNSLALFKTFEKRFCRPADDARALFGYNENPPAIVAVTGPGYFVAYEIPGNEVLIDYTQVPNVDAPRPEGWPGVKLNSAGMSRYIYNGTQDTMRGVSRHVSVGRAARAGQWMDNWFV